MTTNLEWIFLRALKQLNIFVTHPSRVRCPGVGHFVFPESLCGTVNGILNSTMSPVSSHLMPPKALKLWIQVVALGDLVSLGPAPQNHFLHYQVAKYLLLATTSIIRAGEVARTNIPHMNNNLLSVFWINNLTINWCVFTLASHSWLLLEYY